MGFGEEDHGGEVLLSYQSSLKKKKKKTQGKYLSLNWIKLNFIKDRLNTKQFTRKYSVLYCGENDREGN